MSKPKQPKKFTVSLQDIAEAFGLDERRIQQLADEGTIPKPKKRGEYDWKLCTLAYVQHCKKQKAQTPIAKQKEEEELRQLVQMNDDREWESQRKRGAFTPLELVEEFFDAVIPNWEAKIDSVFIRLENLVRQGADIPTIVSYADKAKKEILSELAGTDPVSFIDPAKAEEIDAEARNASESVERQLQEAK